MRTNGVQVLFVYLCISTLCNCVYVHCGIVEVCLHNVKMWAILAYRRNRQNYWLGYDARSLRSGQKRP